MSDQLMCAKLQDDLISLNNDIQYVAICIYVFCILLLMKWLNNDLLQTGFKQ